MVGAALEVMRSPIDNVPAFELRESLSGAPLQLQGLCDWAICSDARPPLGKHFPVLNGDSRHKLLKFFLQMGKEHHWTLNSSQTVRYKIGDAILKESV